MMESSKPERASQTASDDAAAEAPAELDHYVRALSHDMSANLMILESSLGRLKRKSAGANVLASLAEDFAHVDACLRESKRFLDDLKLLGQTGHVDMEPASVELRKLVERVIFEQQPLLEERGMQAQIATALPTVLCNETRLHQVFTNLIRNAARHGGDPHAPVVTISAVRRAADEGPAAFGWIEVHDNGPGIGPDDRESIFLPGERLRGAHPSGSGMGLAIVKKIVESYGGTIWVDPACTQGTAFTLSLPLAPTLRKDLPAPHLRSDGATLHTP